MRISRKVYGESALALFLSGSLALALIILSLSHGFNVNLFNYLFGSIVTVTKTDVWLIFSLSLAVIAIFAMFYKQLVYVSFDEEAAKVSGLPTRLVNMALITLAAVTVALAIPIVGVLLIAALLVIPVITALQLKKSFSQTIIWSELISIFSVISGILIAFYFDLAAAGAIVMIMLVIFTVVFLTARR